ncbi:Metallo-dependent phosphatase, partial [Jaminaea rosea]
LILWAAFIFLLSINFLTLSKERLPSKSAYIGWQALTNIGSTHQNPGGAPGNEEQAAATSQGGAGPGFPMDVYAPLVPNPAPLTEITVRSCVPIAVSLCHPPTTAAEDARLGPWVLVPRPLDAQAMSSSTIGGGGGLGGAFAKIFGALETKFLFYRRSSREDTQKVVDLRLVETGQDPPTTSEDGWHRVHDDLRSRYMRIWGGSSKMGIHLYYRTVEVKTNEEVATKSKGKVPLAESLDPITELDIMYGDGNFPWPGFDIVGQIALGDHSAGRSSTSLTARRKPIPNPHIDVRPKFTSNGTFKILQIADLHFSVDEEPCRDLREVGSAALKSKSSSSLRFGRRAPTLPCHSYNDTVALLNAWLDAEKPDMVVLTGDQLNGQSTSWDAKSVLPKTLKPIIDRKIPWAGILGNHDSQTTSVSRTDLVGLMSEMPYSLTRVGPLALHDGVGAGNYYVRLESPTPDKANVFNLYFLDSGDQEPKGMLAPWGKARGHYDSIRQDQIIWFLEQSGQTKKLLRPYVPDGGVDLPKQDWHHRADHEWDASSSSRSLSKPNALAFTHIPLPEFFDVDSTTPHFGPDRAETSGVIGSQRERGFFDALMAQGEGEREVRAVISGHMHNNGDCEEIKRGGHKVGRGTWMCFGGGASYAAYGMQGRPRMARVYQIDAFGERGSSWTRL